MLQAEIFNYQHAEVKVCAAAELLPTIKNQFIKNYDLVAAYCEAHPEFQFSLQPLPVDQQAPPIIQKMCAAAQQAGVGPMAAVAGGIAQACVEEIMKKNPVEHLIIENGGDIVFYSNQEVVVQIGCLHPQLRKIGLKFKNEKRIKSICSSSGKIGHSLSFGDADIAIVIADNGYIADAIATKVANQARGNIKKIKSGLETIISSGLVEAIILIYDNYILCTGLCPEFVSITEVNNAKN